MKKLVKKNIKKAREYVKILNINVLSTSKRELLANLEKIITHNIGQPDIKDKITIFTPNPELILESQTNTHLRKAMESCDFPVPDGVGLKYASKFLYNTDLNIIPGRILFTDLVEMSAKRGWKVFLLGGEGSEADICENILKKKYPNLQIESFKGPQLNKNGEPVAKVDIKTQKDAVDKINKFSPDFLFLAFGVPKQEIWAEKQIKSLNTHAIMTVGGSFRYVAGLSKLPPAWMEQLGLEWLFRLLNEPHRLTRIINAAVVFPLKVLAEKLKTS